MVMLGKLKIGAGLCAGLVWAAAALLGAGAAFAQTQGPVAPPPKFETKKVDTAPEIKPPPVPAEEIIKKFTANEDVMKKAYDGYSFKQSVHVQEEADPGGDFEVFGEMFMKSDGQRYERIVKTPVSTLK